MAAAFFNVGQDVVYAQPVSAYLAGRAQRMAYEGEKQQQAFVQMQMQDWQKQQDFERQRQAAEVELKAQKQQADQQHDQDKANVSALTTAFHIPDGIQRQRAVYGLMGGDPNQFQPVADQQAYDTQLVTGILKMASATGTEVGDLYPKPDSPETVRHNQEMEDIARDKMAGGGGGGASEKFMPVIDAEGNVNAFSTGTGQMTKTGAKALKSAEGQAAVTTAVEGAKLSTGMRGTLAQTAHTFKNAGDRLRRIRAEIASGPSTGLTAELRAKLDPDLQYVRSLVKGQLMDNVQAAKAGGVTFGQMTMGEWQIVGESGIQLVNQKAANLRILDRLISEADISGRQAVDRGKSDDPAFNFPEFDGQSGGGDDGWKDD